ncbi:hypothetical protein KKB18_13575 [bacterium]|nr:hypothetical protein [bacterium]
MDQTDETNNTKFICLYGEDALGNKSTLASANDINIDVTPPEGPTNLASTDHTVSVWSNDNTITMTWTAATDTGSGVAGYSYIFVEYPEEEYELDMVQDIGPVTTITSSSLPDNGGAMGYYFFIRAVDTLGNWGDTVHLGEFFIDTVPAEISFNWNPQYFGTVNNDSPSISWLIDNDNPGTGGGVAGFECKLDTESFSPCSRPKEYTNLADGPHTFYVRATEYAGNISTASHSWTIDTISSTLAEVTPVPTPTDDTTPDYTFSSTEAGTISYGGDCSSSITEAIAGNNTITFDELSDGTYSNCTITVTDEATNESDPLSVSSFTIDTSYPVLSFIDDVEAGPVASDTITADWGTSTIKKWDYDADGICSISAGDYSKTDINSMNQTTEDNNAKFICLYGENAVGHKTTLASANDINIDAVAPILAEVSAITSPTTDTTPDYTFSSTEAGTISYGGDCSSSTTTAIVGDNTVTFNTLSEEEHSNCTIVVTDVAGNPSNELNVTPFTVQTTVKFVIIDPSDGTVGDNISITIQAQNSDNNVVTNYQNDVTLELSGSATGGGLVNIINGIGTILISDTVAETVTLSLSDTEGTDLDVSSTQDIVFSPGDLDHFVMDEISSPQSASTPFDVTITAKDEYNNTVVLFTGTVDLSTTAGTISVTTTGDFVGGTITESVYVTGAGTGKTITAQRTGGSEIGISNEFDVSSDVVSQFMLNDPGDMTVGTRVGYTVERKDQYGNLVTSGDTTIYLYSSNEGDTDLFYNAATDGDEITSIDITDSHSSVDFWYYDDTSGGWIITASDNNDEPDGSEGIIDASDDITVNLAPIVATKFVILDPADSIVGNITTVTVKAVNGDEDVDTAYMNDVTLNTTGSATGGGILVDIINGVGTINITDTVAETVTLSLEDTLLTGLDVSSTQDVVFSAGSLDHFIIDAIASQAASVPFDVSITAKDQYGNTVTLFTGTVDFTTTAGTISVLTSGNFIEGERTESVYVTGAGLAKTITATKTSSIENGTSNEFDVSSDVVSQFILNDPGNMTAGTRIEYTVERKDQYGNLVTTGGTTVYLYSNSTSANKKFYNAVTGGSVINNIEIQNGESEVNFWYYDDTPGGWTITVSDNGSSPDGSNGIADDADNVTVSAAPIIATRYIIEDPDNVRVNETAEITIKATDDLGNVDVDINDDVTLVVGGSATGAGLVNIVNGVGTINITNTVAETILLSLSDTQSTGLDVSSTQNISFTSISSGGGSSATATSGGEVSFAGITIPKGIVTLFTFSAGQIPVAQNIADSVSGTFNIKSSDLLSGFQFYGFSVRDKNGDTTPSKIFQLNPEYPDLLIKDVLTAPTIDILRSNVTKGGFLSVTGYANKNSTVEFEIDGQKIESTVKTLTDGSYKLLYNTALLSTGNHTIKSKQITANGRRSEFSLTKNFSVVNNVIVATDINGDGNFDARDFSIFISLWGQKDNEEARRKIDLNNDGKVNIQDYSIFIKGLSKASF